MDPSLHVVAGRLATPWQSDQCIKLGEVWKWQYTIVLLVVVVLIEYSATANMLETY